MNVIVISNTLNGGVKISLDCNRSPDPLVYFIDVALFYDSLSGIYFLRVLLHFQPGVVFPDACLGLVILIVL